MKELVEIREYNHLVSKAHRQCGVEPSEFMEALDVMLLEDIEEAKRIGDISDEQAIYISAVLAGMHVVSYNPPTWQ